MSKKSNAADKATAVAAKAALMASSVVAEATEKARILAAEATRRATDITTQVALVSAELRTHEAVCLERYDGIKDDLTTIKKLLAWVGGGGIVTLIGCIGWLLAHVPLLHP